jgi:parvulin-like peptidyl-prolyl isomerase
MLFKRKPAVSLPRSRYERERLLRQIVIYSSLGLGIVVAVLVGLALLQILVLEPQRAVATVGDQPISVRQLQTRMRYEQSQLLSRFSQLSDQLSQLGQGDENTGPLIRQLYQQQLQQLVAQGSAEQIARDALDAMIEELLIKQEANQRGITVTPEEVTEELEVSYGLYRKTLTPFPTYTPVTPPTPEPTPTGTVTETQPTPTPAPTATPRLQPTSISEADFQQLWQNTLASYQPLGLSEQDLRELIANGIYRRRLQDAFERDVPTTAPHYTFDYVRFNNLEEAQKAASRLAAGEVDFAALISQTNAITQPAPIGSGDSVEMLSRFSVRDRFGEAVVEQLANAPLNQPTPVITSSFGSFYILLPRAREEKALEASERQSEGQRLFENWLQAARGDENRVKRLIDPTTIIPSVVRETARNFQAQFGGSTP